MNGHELKWLEAVVRDANPVPQPSTLVGSEESAAVTRLLSRTPEMDVPGLLPPSPAAPLRPSDAEDLLERGRDMDTLERTRLRDGERTRRPIRPRRWRTAAIGFATVVVVGALAGLGLMIFGGDEQPIAPAGPTPDIVFDDPDGELVAHRVTITKLIEETYAAAATLLDGDGMAIAVSPNIPGGYAPDYGVGYSFADVDSVVFAIDPWLPELDEVLPERIPPLVAAALYEMARMRSIEMSEVTLLEEVVLMGLGAHFAEELLGAPVPPWFDAFPASQTEEIIDLARPWLDRSDYDYGHWFRGGKTEIPLWAGYTLGYRMVEDYLSENPDQTAADLVDAPAFLFRPPVSSGGD